MRIPWVEVFAQAKSEGGGDENRDERIHEVLLGEGYCRDVVQAKALLEEKRKIDESAEESLKRTVPVSTLKGEVELSGDQEHARALMLKGCNVFISGSAGTGKTYTVRAIVKSERARRGRGKVFCTSMSGIAACEVQGTTLHSFAGIGVPRGEGEKALVDRVLQNPAAVRRWRECQLLVIDEVSMLDAQLFALLDKIARSTRWNSSDRVFGGIQLLLCGDFYQIPPVGAAQFCFESPLWKELRIHVIELETVYRQTQCSLVDFLNDFRRGMVDEEFLSRLDPANDENSESGKQTNEKTILPTRLFARNRDVDALNQEELTKLVQPIRAFAAYDYTTSEDPSLVHVLDQACPSTVYLATGAQVVLTRNLAVSNGLANGARGVVLGFARLDEPFLMDERSSELAARCDPKEELPIVLFKGQTSPIIVPRVEFVTFDALGTKTSSRVAIPLKLAWALTIHKSQGQTLDPLIVDLSGIFEYGQAFVALSRARSVQGLHIVGYRSGMRLAHPRVHSFYAGLGNKDQAEGVEDSAKTTERNSADEDEVIGWTKRLRSS